MREEGQVAPLHMFQAGETEQKHFRVFLQQACNVFQNDDLGSRPLDVRQDVMDDLTARVCHPKALAFHAKRLTWKASRQHVNSWRLPMEIG